MGPFRVNSGELVVQSKKSEHRLGRPEVLVHHGENLCSHGMLFSLVWGLVGPVGNRAEYCLRLVPGEEVISPMRCRESPQRPAFERRTGSSMTFGAHFLPRSRGGHPSEELKGRKSLNDGATEDISFRGQRGKEGVDARPAERLNNLQVPFHYLPVPSLYPAASTH